MFTYYLLLYNIEIGKHQRQKLIQSLYGFGRVV